MNVYVEKDIKKIGVERWAALLSKDPSHTVYQTYAWNMVAAETYAPKDGLFIVCAREGDELLAILPLVLRHENGRRVLRFMAAARSDYSDIICPLRCSEIIPSIWAHILSLRSEWDLICLQNVPEDSTLSAYFKDGPLFKRQSCVVSRENASVLLFKQDVGYTQKVLNKKRLHKYREHLRKNGTYEVLHLTEASGIRPHLEDYFDQHIHRWEGTAWPSLFKNEDNKAFYRKIVEELPQGWITFSMLKWQGRPAAYHLGFSLGRKFIWYKPCYEVELAAFSVGQVLLQEVLEQAQVRGFDEFDMGIGKDAYKGRFANVFRRNRTFEVYPSRSSFLWNYFPRAVIWRLKHLFS